MQPQENSSPSEPETVPEANTPNRPPAVMQPHETSAVMGTTAWNAMPTEWTGDDYAYMDPPLVMTHSDSIDGSMESGSSDSMHFESNSMDDSSTATMGFEPSMDDSSTTTMDYEGDSSTTTIYGVRIGASAPAMLSSSTILFTTYSESTYTSDSHIVTSSFPVTSTVVTLVPMIPTMAPVSSARRQRQRQRPESTASEASFFPDRFVSARSSFVDVALEKGLTTSRPVSSSEPANVERDPLDRLELVIPQLQITPPMSPGVSLRDTLAVLPTTTIEPEEQLASCQASIIDAVPYSPTSSSGSSAAARQEQLASEMDMAQEEISVLEKRASPQRLGAVPGGQVGVAERRIEALYARIQELERVRAMLRLEAELTMAAPPEYMSTEG
ncbi:hypothetical protein B0H12DRAFT_660861 [Mycena haematopus]|nr:hypothetical protein B0H12DRAFT_660861 [Mycena haematopus]